MFDEDGCGVCYLLFPPRVPQRQPSCRLPVGLRDHQIPLRSKTRQDIRSFRKGRVRVKLSLLLLLLLLLLFGEGSDSGEVERVERVVRVKIRSIKIRLQQD